MKSNLPDSLRRTLTKMCDEADALDAGGDFRAAYGRFEEVWNRIPEDKALRPISTRVLR